MSDIFRFPGPLSATEGALVALSVLVLALFVVTLAVSAYAILLRTRHARRDRLWAELSEEWEQPVLSAIVDPDTIPAAQAAVPEEYELHFVNFVLEYTRRVRGEERRTLRVLAEPYLDKIAERTRHRNSEVRTRAVQTLGTLGLPRYAPEVLAGLDDPSPLVSMVAARYLAREEFPQFAPAVMKRLKRFDGWNRRFLASMLAAIGGEASPALRSGLADSESPNWLRSVHAEALRMQLDPVAGDLAITALEDTDDREFIAALLRLLAAVGRPEHVPTIRALCSSTDVLVRAQALHALGLLGDEAEIPLLLEAMFDASPWAAVHAARGVREAGGRHLLVEMAGSAHQHARLARQVLAEEDEP